MKRVALVPFKRLSSAKARLAPILSLPERQELAFAMLWDVLSALSRTKDLDEIALVSSEIKALKLAEAFNIKTIQEPNSPGESRSVEEASRSLAAEGADSILVIPGDVPLVTPEEVETLIGMDTRKPLLIMVPSRDGDGTNALLRHPPDVIASHFGPGSFKKHSAEAEVKGIPIVVRELPGIGLDIDTPGDLTILAQKEVRCHAWDLLRERGWAPRLMKFNSNSATPSGNMKRL